MWLFLTIGTVNKNIKTKESFGDNHRHNILRVFDVLPIFLFFFFFTTSEIKRDY